MAEARSSTPGIGLRQNDERRSHDRRRRTRASGDRRSTDRRRKQLGGLLIAVAALTTPQHFKTATLQAAARVMKVHAHPTVQLSIDEFRAIRPEDAYEDLIQEAAVQHKLDPNLIRAVMRTESAFKPHAVSRAGAQGLMQLMPGLARDMGVDNPFDPRENIMGGARYLRQLLVAHGGNLQLTLASYNAGPANVKRYKGIPPFKETRNYVKKITGLLEEAAEAAGAETQE